MKYLQNIENFVKDKTVFCGIDVHDSHWNICYFCDGHTLEKIKIHGDFKHLITHSEKLYSNANALKFVYEAGFSGFWLQRKLSELGYECIVTPPSRLPNYNDKVKTDKKDAAKLAQFLAAGLLKKVSVPPPSIEADRQLVRLRHNYKIKMTRVKNQINSLLQLHGIKWNNQNNSRWTKKFIHWLELLELPNSNLRFFLDQLLCEYHSIRAQITEITKQIRKMTQNKDYQKHFKILTSCKGVGLITAMTFLLELGDISRFKNSTKFAGYLGLTPAQYSSGEHVRLGHISREGNSFIRAVLVESAWTVIRHDPAMKNKYERIKARGTNGKKAIVAVARSLAIRLRQCIINEQPYVIGIV